MAADSNPRANTQKTIFAQVQPRETHERYRVFDRGGVTLPLLAFSRLIQLVGQIGVRKGSQ
jgi:hypothetical protein